MPTWVSNAICMKCKKKGHLSFNCPPKYTCKVIKPKTFKSKIGNKDTANIVQDIKGDSEKGIEFAGMASVRTNSDKSTWK